MNKRLIRFALSGLVLAAAISRIQAATLPNIVILYADDLGYGDVSCYGASHIRTPHMDRLAEQGLRFTDAHSASATCTPSRYAMLTGEYAWRRKGTGVLPGNARLIIEPGRTTLASILRRAGYATGIVGKWHLGLGDGNLDWNGPIRPGPLELGFDYCFLLPATGDRVPCVYVENHRVVGLDPADPIRVSYDQPLSDEPTGKDRPDLLRMPLTHGHDQTIINGISRIGYMSGGRSARWVDEDMADVFIAKAVSFMEKHREEPFFLVFSAHDIHVPRVPHKRFAGTSGMGPRGDAILQFDACVGALLDALERFKLADNTLVILTSDNGAVVDDGYQDEAVEKLGGHTPSGPWRGGKYSSFEGGTRVPLAVRWPGRVKPGVSEALVCQIDFPASLAALVRQSLADEDAPDSMNVLPALLGESRAGRDHLVEHALALSLRHGQWKYIEPGNAPAVNRLTNTELGNAPTAQLYDLSADPGERRNLAEENKQKTRELADLLADLRRKGRSR